MPQSMMVASGGCHADIEQMPMTFIRNFSRNQRYCAAFFETMQNVALQTQYNLKHLLHKLDCQAFDGSYKQVKLFTF